MNKKYNQTYLSISAKCSDLYSHTIYKANGEIYREYSGYVPSFFPEDHFGDYIMLDINPYTGQILNWKNWKLPFSINEKNKEEQDDFNLGLYLLDEMINDCKSNNTLSRLILIKTILGEKK